MTDKNCAAWPPLQRLVRLRPAVLRDHCLHLPTLAARYMAAISSGVRARFKSSNSSSTPLQYPSSEEERTPIRNGAVLSTEPASGFGVVIFKAPSRYQLITFAARSTTTPM